MSDKEKNTVIFLAETNAYNAAEDKDHNVIGRRIAASRKNAGLSLAAFSKRLLRCGISVSPSAINKWEGGTSIPNSYQLMAISHALGMADMYYYFVSTYRPALNRAGFRKVHEYISDLIASGRYMYTENDHDIEMPILDLRKTASLNLMDAHQGFTFAYFPQTQVPEGADFGVYADEDSMFPVYHDGDLIWCRKCRTLSPGDIGVLIYCGQWYVRIYGEKAPDDKYTEAFTDSNGIVHPQPILVPFNHKSPAIYIYPDTQFYIIGKTITQ